MGGDGILKPRANKTHSNSAIRKSQMRIVPDVNPTGISTELFHFIKAFCCGNIITWMFLFAFLVIPNTTQYTGLGKGGGWNTTKREHVARRPIVLGENAYRAIKSQRRLT
ncbi:uncharacterized protein F4822DRAFT_430220 [Hypoxylon trugodes]|uniref:uncharacterized protein n=1 Tax=Hypoxylon trugodes TaxID=326681 RepID=UPI00219BDE11|nr:uncharacterized protein F4822DRAFT_430220 [Hypoxylon trugodes]KAI1387472.1 hypothetical protein F4822DRAFT_430220 [Hypoxylon trugodes]